MANNVRAHLEFCK